MTDPSRKEIAEAVAYIRGVTPLVPEIAIILGSGLGALADSVSDPVVVEAASVPNLPATSVTGHRGRFVFGRLGGRSVVVIQGRLHMYEGHNAAKTVYPVRIAHALGATCLFVTNASGGINAEFVPGTLMWITDHINHTGVSPPQTTRPLQGEPAEWPARKWSDYYDLEWTSRGEKAARDMGVETKRGTYLWTRGPSYETKAEIRFFRTMGADAVGMSTVPEVIQAKRDGMSVIGLSTITNAAAGMSGEPLNHEEVIETGQQVRESLESLAVAVIRAAPAPTS